MSSTSTTWTTDTNTKSGTVQIYSSNVSVLRIVADEGDSAILDLFADQGDDNADKWRLWVHSADDDLHFSNYTTGTSWTDILTLQDGGNVGIGTATPDDVLDVTVASGQFLFKTGGELVTLRGTADDGSGGLSCKKDRSGGVITSGDILGYFYGYGHDGTDYANAGASILLKSSGTIGNNRIPGEIQFWTSTDASTSVPTQRMTIDDGGNVGIGTA